MIDDFYRCDTVIVPVQLAISGLIESERVDYQVGKTAKQIQNGHGGITEWHWAKCVCQLSLHSISSHSHLLNHPSLHSHSSNSFTHPALPNSNHLLSTEWCCGCALGLNLKVTSQQANPDTFSIEYMLYILFESLMTKVLLPILHFCFCHYNNSRL